MHKISTKYFHNSRFMPQNQAFKPLKGKTDWLPNLSVSWESATRASFPGSSFRSQKNSYFFGGRNLDHDFLVIFSWSRRTEARPVKNNYSFLVEFCVRLSLRHLLSSSVENVRKWQNKLTQRFPWGRILVSFACDFSKTHVWDIFLSIAFRNCLILCLPFIVIAMQ